MKEVNDAAFKEWAVACEALRSGAQTVLIRKGGIREEGGVFQVKYPEFFLLPTYEHQNAALLQPAYVSRLQAIQSIPRDPDSFTIDSYAIVDTIATAKNDEQVNAIAQETVWNADYVSQRFDFNPYDPLYLLLLRVYRLQEPITLPMRPAYGGCTSWITLEQPLSTQNATPALADEVFAERRAALLAALKR